MAEKKRFSEDKFWHIRTSEEVLHETGSNIKGLTENEAEIRLNKFGKNSLAREDKFRIFKIFLKNINNLLIYVLSVAALISFFLGEMLEFYILLFIVFITVFLSFIQEYSADKTIKALSKLAAKKIEVIRNGSKKQILSEDIVPGDIIILKRGVIVPADARIIQNKGLIVDEAILTGESIPKAKVIEVMKQQDMPIGDRDNMVFSGTNVTAGEALAVVVETGLHSEIGKITRTITEIKDQKSPLQEKVEVMSKQISFIVIGIAFLLFLFLMYKGAPLAAAIILVGALAVAGIPESFPLAMTMTLSLGVKRMAKKNALIKNLNSVETLGTTTVICTDKTGTLTENKMRIVKFMPSLGIEYDVEGRPYEPFNIAKKNGEKISNSEMKKYSNLFESMILCNNSELEIKDGAWQLSGEPTEGSFLTLAKSLGYDDIVLRENRKRVFEVPFDPSKKFMITVTKEKNEHLVSIKGASERVLEKCSYVRTQNGKKKIDKKIRNQILKIIDSYSMQGLRVLAVGSKSFTSKSKTDKYLSHTEKDYILEGIVGIEDPIREDVFKAIEDCKNAGIKVVMITGDHVETARSIGKKLSIINSESDLLMLGSEIDQLTDEELDEKIGKVAIFARTSPEHKFRIVCSLQRRGEIVAMTGDGVNDAPALKKADIGVSMGKNGTEVAREASDMILTDDNFSTIVHAVKEGRTIYSNIRRFVHYLLTVNFAQVGIICLAVLVGYINLMPLTPLMILFINIITSTPPALALSVEPTHGKVMKQKPRIPKEKILSEYILTKTLIIFPIMVIGAFALFLWELEINGGDLAKAMTLTFVVMVLTGLFHTFNTRRLHSTIFDSNFFSNPYVFISVFASFLLVILAVYTSFGQMIFGTVPLDGIEWALAIIFGLSVVAFSELIKHAIKSEVKEQTSIGGLKSYLE